MSIDNDTNDRIEENKQASDKSKDNKHHYEIPQPFLIKTEKKKGWKKQEIITAVGIVISGALFTMTLLTFNKTRHAIATADANLSHMIWKDSIASIANIKKDSLDSIRRGQDYERDTIARRQAEQSLQAQITSLQEAQRQFEVINRPFLQVTTP